MIISAVKLISKFFKNKKTAYKKAILMNGPRGSRTPRARLVILLPEPPGLGPLVHTFDITVSLQKEKPPQRGLFGAQMTPIVAGLPTVLPL